MDNTENIKNYCELKLEIRNWNWTLNFGIEKWNWNWKVELNYGEPSLLHTLSPLVFIPESK
jgi:hypothetical protein